MASLAGCILGATNTFARGVPMSTRSFSIRAIDESLEDYISIAGESLLAFDQESWRTYIRRIGQENMRGVYDAERLAGGLAFYRMGIWFGGKEISCVGISGVAINPVDRGTGACGALLRSVLRELREEAMPLASLYASTQYLYRTVGFEHAGTQTKYSLPLASLDCDDRSLPIHRFISPPIDKLDQVADSRAAATNGNLGRTDGLWQRLLDPYDGRGTITYLLGDLNAPEGFAILRPGTRDAGHPQPLVSTDVAANTPRGWRRLCSLIRDHRSMCDTFEWFGAPNDSLHFLAAEQFVNVKAFTRWMLRIVDLPAALTARGYDHAVDGRLHLEIKDDLLTENSGRWLLSVADGKATVEPGGEGHFAIDIRSLASLYSSFYSADELIRVGAVAACDPGQVELASRLFAGPAPWVPELY